MNLSQTPAAAVHTIIHTTIMAIMDTTCAMALFVYITHPVNMDTVNQTIVKTPEVVLLGFGGP